MKTFEELQAIRQKTLAKVAGRREKIGTRVIVGMGEVGIEAGARDIVLAIMDAFRKRDLYDLTLMQNGNLEKTGNEPIVMVEIPGKDTVTYTNVNVDMIDRIVDEHVVGGTPVSDYIKA